MNLANELQTNFSEYKFSAFEVLNLYPLMIIKYVIQKANIVIPAWGVEKKYN